VAERMEVSLFVADRQLVVNDFAGGFFGSDAAF
jgi:hypothetical protein